MTSEKRVAIIGGGLVGLSTAYAISNRWPDARLEVLEKEPEVARHQSGRNSGVIHSGIYYAPGSLKAELCRVGRSRLVEFCEREHVAHEVCGKVIVAASKAEISRLEAIRDRGLENGIRCSLLNSKELAELEPHARGVAAIYVPDAGIVDFSGVAQCLKRILLSRGNRVRTNALVSALRQDDRFAQVQIADEWLSYDLVINCGGLHSDRLAKMAGAQLDMQILPFRGVYYELGESARHLCKNLIYPVPDSAYPFLGVHFTKTTDGRIEVGPNAVLATGREGYRASQVNAQDLVEAFGYTGFRRMARLHWRKGLAEMKRTASRRSYVKALQTLVPSVTAADLLPCRSGIRAQAIRADGSMVDDFVVIEQPKMIHVCNAPSPAATACLAIGENIADRAARKWS